MLAIDAQLCIHIPVPMWTSPESVVIGSQFWTVLEAHKGVSLEL